MHFCSCLTMCGSQHMVSAVLRLHRSLWSCHVRPLKTSSFLSALYSYWHEQSCLYLPLTLFCILRCRRQVVWPLSLGKSWFSSLSYVFLHTWLVQFKVPQFQLSVHLPCMVAHHGVTEDAPVMLKRLSQKLGVLQMVSASFSYLL